MDFPELLQPAVGAFSDLLVRGGGTTILTEVPEMFVQRLC